MFIPERTKRMVVILYCVTAVSFILAIISWAKGGGDLLFNYPFASVLMVAFLALAIMALLVALSLTALSKDIAEELKYMSERNKK